MALQYHADLARDRGDHAEASAEYEEALELMRRAGNAHGIAYSLRGLGHLARNRGEYARASRLLGESLALLKELRDRRCIPLCLEGIACMVVGPAWAERATRLLGAAYVVQEDTGAPAPPSEMADYQRTAADARAAIGEERFAEIWAAGNALSLEEAVSFAMDESKAAELAHANTMREPTRRVPVEPATRTAEPGSRLDVRDDGSVSVPLSAREREVVACIAAGLSNRQIAEQLVLSVRTVERHIENVYNRLGISGRAGRAIVTAYALRHHLIESA
jgi:non-specific serine/threonine protein kinase